MSLGYGYHRRGRRGPRSFATAEESRALGAEDEAEAEDEDEDERRVLVNQLRKMDGELTALRNMLAADGGRQLHEQPGRMVAPF